jgi:hypothetical protein
MEIIDFKDLGIMIPKDRVFISFDISTSCIGVSIFNENFELTSVKALKMTTNKDCKDDPEITKGDAFKKFVEELKIYEIIDIFVEEPLVKSNNVYTVNKLLKFNGICSYILRDVLGLIPKFMSVDEVRRIFCPEMTEYDAKKNKFTLKFKSRKIDPKTYIFEKISKEYDNISWIYNKNNKLKTENFDITDSIALAKASFKKHYEKEY